MNEEIFRAEFGRDAVNSTDQPLTFVIGEVQAIIERGSIPVDVSLLLTAAQKIVVTISVE